MKVFKFYKASRMTGQIVFLLSMAIVISSCGDKNNNSQFQETFPVKVKEVETPESPVANAKEIAEGKQIFRHETFGNEGFWSDAARLPQGMIVSKLTPIGLLKLGLSINTEKLSNELTRDMRREFIKDGMNGKILNDAKMTVKLLNTNAIIGLVARDSNLDGRIDLNNGDKLGVSCVLCHGVTDRSLIDLQSGGSVGKLIDGPAAHRLNLGALLSVASNTRAFFPLAQIKDEDGLSIGRAPSASGLDKHSSEAEFDAYFSHSTFYPVGSFDDTLDGIGNPLRTAPAFRVDLSAPYGAAGEFAELAQYLNHIYTGIMDPTNILSKEGRSFMERVSGPLGVRLSEDYAAVLSQTGVKDYPYVKGNNLAVSKSVNALMGASIDERHLQNLNLYLVSLRAPKGVAFEKSSVSRGEELFRSGKVGCTSCHNADQTLAVMKDIVVMNVIFKGDNPVPLLKRDNLIHPLQNTTASTYDDKMIVMNARLRGLSRGVAMPLLMDLAKKTGFLHDGSVSSLYKLLDPIRGDNAPHAYYIESSNDRNDVVAYLKNLDDERR